MSKSFQIWDHFFLLLFPKDSKNLKSLDIGRREVQAKIPLNWVRKCDGQKNTQTHIRTFQLIERISQEGQSFWKSILRNHAWWSVGWLIYFLFCSPTIYEMLTILNGVVLKTRCSAFVLFHWTCPFPKQVINKMGACP